MKGKVCLVTGSNSGIGKETALRLARLGAHVIMVCRNEAKGKEARDEIISLTKNNSIDLLIADLSSQKDIRRLAEEVKAKYNRLDILINNAGLMLTERSETEDGIETTFAVNHLAYFLLTNLLLNLIKSSTPARIINVSSDLHYNGNINFSDLEMKQKYNGLAAYNNSKLANVVFTNELAERLKGTGVTVNSLHPGVIATNLGVAKNSGLLITLFKFAKMFMKSPEKGAETSLYLATSPEVENVTGKYFDNSKEKIASPKALDKNTQTKLWEISEKMTGIKTTV